MRYSQAVWHREAPYNRFFPCMEATYPCAVKNQQRARKPLVGGFGCLELVLYGIRELA